MAISVPIHLSPRKRPRQARAGVTLDAIFEATIQLLAADGPQRLTMTRVAQRAGVSVGTIYQYLPHKQALIYALNERYLETLAGTIEAACSAQRGSPIDRMVEVLVETYWRAKTERPEVTRALYRSVAELDNALLVEAFATRVDGTTSSMLASAPDATFADLDSVNLTLLTVIFGTVRNAFERNLPLRSAEALRDQLLLMCRSYIGAASHVRQQ